MSQVTSSSKAISAVVAALGPSVVGLRRGGRRGSGIVVARDQVIALRHSAGHSPLDVVLADGRVAEGEVSGIDRRRAIALLSVDTGDAPAVRFADAEPALGDAVYALANPGGSGLRATSGYVSSGPLTVRGRHGRAVEGVIEHTAPLPRGSGGGALADATGAILGLNVLRADPGFLLALPASAVRPAVERLLAGGEQSVHLGVALVPAGASRRMRAAVGLPERDGLLVREVEVGGPAERAGVRAGDLLVGLGSRELRDVEDVFAALDAAEESFALRVVRGAEELELTVERSVERPA